MLVDGSQEDAALIPNDRDVIVHVNDDSGNNELNVMEESERVVVLNSKRRS